MLFYSLFNHHRGEYQMHEGKGVSTFLQGQFEQLKAASERFGESYNPNRLSIREADKEQALVLLLAEIAKHLGSSLSSETGSKQLKELHQIQQGLETAAKDLYQKYHGELQRYHPLEKCLGFLCGVGVLSPAIFAGFDRLSKMEDMGAAIFVSVVSLSLLLLLKQIPPRSALLHLAEKNQLELPSEITAKLQCNIQKVRLQGTQTLLDNLDNYSQAYAQAKAEQAREQGRREPEMQY